MIDQRFIRTALIILILGAASGAVRSQSSLPFFGIQTHFGQDRTGPDTAMAIARSAGIGAIRDEVYWHEVESAPGVFTFQAKHDAYIQAAVANGLQPLIILDYGHPLYGGTPRDSSSRAAFARYCSTTVARYGPLGVRHYEVWNEPNLCLPEFCPWLPAPSPEEYVELLRVAYHAIKSADPSAVVLAGATSPLDEPESTQKIPGVAFIQRIMGFGAGDVCDAISFHQYPVNRAPEDWVPSEVSRMRAVAPGRRFWITEAGHHTSSAYGGVSELVQAKWLVRAILVGQGIEDLDRLSWYDLQDDCQDPANPECRYGILRQDGTPKPAFEALAKMHEIVGRRPFVGVIQSEGAYEATFGGGDSVVRAIWTATGSVVRSVPVPTPYAQVRSMLGTTTSVVGSSGGAVTITVTDEPTYVIALPDGPTMNRLEINPGSSWLDSSQTLQYEIAGWTTDDIRVPLNSSSVSWQAVGSAVEISPNGVVTAVAAGEATVIASVDGLIDTASVRVVAPRGAWSLGPMEPSAWSILTELMDTATTRLESSGGSSMLMRYGLTYRQVNANKYVVRLRPRSPMLIPGRADTIKLWFAGDGQNHAVLFQIADRDKEWFPTIPRRVNWPDVWRPIAVRIDPGSGRFDLPASVDEIDLYIVPAVAPVDGSIIEGVLGLDSLQAMFRPRSATSARETDSVPWSIHLAAFPNPFNPSTTIRYVVPSAASVRLEVFDLMGRRVSVLIDGDVGAGEHEVNWSSENASSGVYVARLTTPHQRTTHRLLLVR